MTSVLKPLSLYLHFPFCVRKCRYCDFLSFPAGEDARDAYLERLKEEIMWQAGIYGKEYEISTIFIGGGTPSLMSGRQMSEILDTVRRCFWINDEAEISVECNPGTVDGRKLSEYAKAGVNRISFGLQSMNDDELRYLGRIHTVREFTGNFDAARRAGFENINVDLMSGLPGQSVASWLDTLRRTAGLYPEHISAYSLIIEEGTPFWDIYADASGGDGAKTAKVPGPGATDRPEVLPLPDEEIDREMYHLTKSVLDGYGYSRYEISNYARDGHECRHNLVYWRRGDYLGLGLGSSSMINNRRFTQTDNMKSYMNEPFGQYVSDEILDQKSRMEETLFLGLRCTSGISPKDFERCFGKTLKSVYGQVIDKYEAMELLVYDEPEDRMYLTERGLDVSNIIMADFLL